MVEERWVPPVERTGPAVRAAGCLALAAALPLAAHATAYSDLTAMSFEELANIEITSVSKKKERMSGAAASVFVITRDDIARNGATTLPEALRLAPNLQVARVDARNYAVTARGFNSAFANKLLVLIDGRSLYSPLFSGVFWDAQDVMLEDIDRIEVISGAGATLWGANAVNGVINVVTRRADETQGSLVALGLAEQERQFAVRHGGVAGQMAFVRTYGKHSDAKDTRRADSTPRYDGWHRSQAGVRADLGRPADGTTLQADAYTARLHQKATRDIHTSGLSASGHVRSRLAEASDLSLHATLEHITRDQPGAFEERLTIFNADFQHAFGWGDAHRLVWGAGYRVARDRIDPQTGGFAFLPAHLTLHWSNVFVQDEIALGARWSATAGLKFEHNSYTGVEPLPNLRLAWRLSDTQLLWGSAARAVRAPSRIDRDLYVPASPIVVGGTPQFVIAGGPGFDSEIADVFELGYRGQPAPAVSYSVTAFHADYDRLRTAESNPGGLPGTVQLGNGAQARSRGVEMWGAWQVLPDWRLSGGLVSQSLRLRYRADSQSPSKNQPMDDTDPRHYWMLRSSIDLSEHTSLDLTLRHVGQLRRPAVPAYEALDLHLAWRVRAGFELSLAGRNLLDARHPEFAGEADRSEFERSLFLKMLWQL